MSDALPMRMLTNPRMARATTSPGTVAIIGGGFAGLCAAWTASQLGFQVTLFESSAGIGGRVNSSSNVVSGRIIERGGELIGSNHVLWVAFAQLFGLGLSVATSEDVYDTALLSSPLYLKGQLLDASQQEELNKAMGTIFTSWCNTAITTLPSTYPWMPWMVSNAATLDAMSLTSQIPPDTDPDVVDAITTEFYLDNCVDPANQSWLSNLAQFSAGSTLSQGSDPLGFFDDSEVFRCENGNQSLASAFAAVLPAGSIVANVKIASISIDTSVSLKDSSDHPQGRFDYAILAVPVSQYANITVNGEILKATAHGPAVKYLAPLQSRFWIQDQLSPSGMSDELGMTWEGTDNQMIQPQAPPGTATFDLSVFIGGKLAQTAIDNGGSDSYFAPLLGHLYSNFPSVTGDFVNWPGDSNIGTGYSSPGLNEVTTIQKTYASPISKRLFLAGEHTSPAWFGFMEGALESGYIAAIRMADAAKVDVDNLGSMVVVRATGA